LIDEIYDMAAPILLGEQEAYIDLLVETVHREDLIPGSAATEAFRQREREKLEALGPLVRRLRLEAPGNFAHIAHYDNAGDLRREHTYLKGVPDERFQEWAQRSFPTVVELNFRGFREGLPSVRGWILLVNNTTEQLINSNKLRRTKILQCAHLANVLGAQCVGMAGLIAFFGKGGYFLSEQFPNLGFTTGHAYTIANIMEIAKASSARAGLQLTASTVAIVGAAGSIGSGMAALFAQLGVPRLVLIDILSGDYLEAVAQRVREIDCRVNVVCSNRVQDMKSADLTIVATNSPRTIIQPDYLKSGSIVIDDAFPKNVPESTAKVREDVVALEGGAARLPRDLEIDRARNLPNILDVPFTRMVSCQEVYSCFVETLTLAAHGHRGNYGLGASDPSLAMDIWARAKKLGIAMAPLQFFGQAIGDEHFRRIADRRHALTENQSWIGAN